MTGKHLNLNEIWDTHWANQYNLTLEKDNQEDTWRSAGRITAKTPNKEDSAWWYKNGLSFLEAWVEWRNKYNWKIITLGNEPAIELEIIPNFNGVPVKMTIDRIMQLPTGEIVVVDLKTGSRTPESDLQLGFYASGIEKIYGIRPSHGAYWMARQGEVGPILPLESYSVEIVGRMVRLFDKARKSGVFLPNFSHCKLCALKDQCAWRNGSDSDKYPIGVI
jgi:hypothetical protein